MAKKVIIVKEGEGPDCYLHKTKCDGKLYGFRNNQPEEINGGGTPSGDYVINGLNPDGVHAKTPGVGQPNNSFVIETGKFVAAGSVVNGQYALNSFDFDSDYIRMKFNDGVKSSYTLNDAEGFHAKGENYEFVDVPYFPEGWDYQGILFYMNGYMYQINPFTFLDNTVFTEVANNYYDKTEINNAFSKSPALATETGGNFILNATTNKYRVLSTGANVTLTDGAPAVNCGTEYAILIFNTASTPINVTFPTGTNYTNMKSFFTIDGNGSAEVIIKAYGVRRVGTYVILEA